MIDSILRIKYTSARENTLLLWRIAMFGTGIDCGWSRSKALLSCSRQTRIQRLVLWHDLPVFCLRGFEQLQSTRMGFLLKSRLTRRIISLLWRISLYSLLNRSPISREFGTLNFKSLISLDQIIILYYIKINIVFLINFII